MLTRREVFDKLNETKQVPSPSGTTLKIIQLCHDETTSLNDIAEIIQTDPALKIGADFMIGSPIRFWINPTPNSISENSGGQLSNLLCAGAQRLADRTEVCTAVTDDHPLDRSATAVTGLGGTLVHPEIVLEIPPAVNPIDAGAVPLDPLCVIPGGCWTRDQSPVP